jgi:hypothetical protein
MHEGLYILGSCVLMLILIWAAVRTDRLGYGGPAEDSTTDAGTRGLEQRTGDEERNR